MAVLVDHSRSMAISDADGVPRIEAARDLVRDRLLPGLGESFEVEVLAFGEMLAAADVDGFDSGCVTVGFSQAPWMPSPRGSAGRAIAGIVVVSDGVETGEGDVAEVAARSPAPIYALGVGNPRPGPDREVTALEAGQPVGTGSVVDVRATVVSHGLGGDPFDVRLTVDDRLVAVRRVRPVRDGTPIIAVFRVAPDPVLPSVYAVEVPVDAAELVSGNNRRQVLVSPPERPRRLLLVEGSPGYEHSFLKRTWLADPGGRVRCGGAERTERTRGADLLRPGRSGADRRAGHRLPPDARGAVPVRRGGARQHRGGILPTGPARPDPRRSSPSAAAGSCCSDRRACGGEATSVRRSNRSCRRNSRTGSV